MPLTVAALMVLLLAIIAGSLTPARWMPSWLPNDKLLHAMAYGLAAMLLFLQLGDPWARLWALVALLMLGWGLECFQQRLVQGREFSKGDLMANGVGVLLGVGLAIGWGTWHGTPELLGASMALPGH
ncbi:hypothetical protein [Ectothiorhodospira variabilis]|uniref:hypothetical protein n=1 Tax=Ectothiorhodospira variabilis TaxID=505694 RepID=UPI001EFB57EA|nr:hypothetical protein [Ectothiorhodospira variabilis]MCG5495701.1 hypothetical protein [Ectothiorhodospira variabilis]MCG5504597.1 hypothetical protein [Ectothiorhodospira variabilis]MCG5507695.1 hypothetical protein [Ectothiorhodospira variabilis]